MSAHALSGISVPAGLDIRVEDLEDAVARRNPTATRAEVKSAIGALISRAIGEGKNVLGEPSSAPSVERHTGAGLGVPIGLIEGRRRLSAFSAPMAIEDWAGPVAGPGEVASRLGISRSTLHNWNRSGIAIGLRKGTRKHVYPLAQFVDGRPVPGLATVVEIVGDSRSAWLWLVEPHHGDAPTCLERLRRGETADVLDAAREDFA